MFSPNIRAGRRYVNHEKKPDIEASGKRLLHCGQCSPEAASKAQRRLKHSWRSSPDWNRCPSHPCARQIWWRSPFGWVGLISGRRGKICLGQGVFQLVFYRFIVILCFAGLSDGNGPGAFHGIVPSGANIIMPSERRSPSSAGPMPLLPTGRFSSRFQMPSRFFGRVSSSVEYRQDECKHHKLALQHHRARHKGAGMGAMTTSVWVSPPE